MYLDSDVMRVIGPFIKTLVVKYSLFTICITATTLFLDCGKKAWIPVVVDDAIKLAHVLFYI